MSTIEYFAEEVQTKRIKKIGELNLGDRNVSQSTTVLTCLVVYNTSSKRRREVNMAGTYGTVQ